MTRQVEFFFDVVSSATYLAWTQLPAIAKETGAEIVWRPMLLGGLFKATGNQAPLAVPPKGAHMWVDLRRWARLYGVEFKVPDVFPVNTVPVMRGAVAYQDSPVFDDYLRAMFEGMWVHGRNLQEPDVLTELVTQAGIDPEEFQARIQDQAVKDQLKANTDEAATRGAFGAPTFFVDGEMYWGNDRLHFVREALRA